MRSVKKINDEMERMVRSPYAQYNVDKIGVLAWVLGFADSIPKGIKLAHSAAKSNNSTDEKTP